MRNVLVLHEELLHEVIVLFHRIGHAAHVDVGTHVVGTMGPAGTRKVHHGETGLSEGDVQLAVEVGIARKIAGLCLAQNDVDDDVHVAHIHLAVAVHVADTYKI